MFYGGSMYGLFTNTNTHTHVYTVYIYIIIHSFFGIEYLFVYVLLANIASHVWAIVISANGDIPY